MLVIGGGPSAAWAAVGAASASARINSTGPSGQAMAVLDLAHRQHPTDRGVLMALVSITRDTGDFEKPLRHARALVTLDSADTRLRSAVSDLEKPLPHWQARDLPPLWTN